MGRPTLVLLNPEAGSCDDVDRCRRLLGRIPDSEVAVLTSAGAMSERVLRALEEDRERIVIAGGDGTVHRAVQPMADADGEVPVLGVLPVGTANDLARSLAVPLDLEEAVEWIATAPDRLVDLVEMSTADGETTWCVNVATGGFGGRVTDRVDREEKRHWGSLAYLRSAIEELSDLPRYRVRLEVADGEVVEWEVVNLVVANGSYSGGGIAVAPRARLDDGSIDVVGIPPLGLGQFAKLASAALAGDLQDQEEVLSLRTDRLEVRAEPPMRFRCDGERAASTPLAFRVVPRALRVIAGGEAEG